MLIDTRKLLLIAAFVAFCAASAAAQTCPAGMICLTQAEANAAAENARVRIALESQVVTLEQSVKDKDANTEVIRTAAAKNEADLRKALNDTEVKLAEKTGEVIQLEADRVRWAAVIDVLIKNTRPKKIGLINLF